MYRKLLTIILIVFLIFSVIQAAPLVKQDKLTNIDEGDDDDDDDPIDGNDDIESKEQEYESKGFWQSFEVESKGKLTVESRVFEEDHDNTTEDIGLGLYSRLELKITNGPLAMEFRGVSRVNEYDQSRNIIYIEEAWLGVDFFIFNLRAGYQLFNWTATEAFHPADILNSRNFDSNIENFEKLGEPTISLITNIKSAEFSLYYMPTYQVPFFQGPSSRLAIFKPPAGSKGGSFLMVDKNGNISDDDFGDQFAFRYKQSIAGLDLGIHGVYHTTRDQILIAVNPLTNTISPIFQRVVRAGGTLQWALDGLISKAEVGYSKFDKLKNSVTAKYKTPNETGLVDLEATKDHTTIALGFEYGWDVFRGGQLTALLEGQHLVGLSKFQRANLSAFQSDVLIGVRLALNDISDKTLLISSIIDTERKKEFLLNLSYSQRLNDTWSISLGARRVIAPQKGTTPIGLEILDEANQYYINLTRSF